MKEKEQFTMSWWFVTVVIVESIISTLGGLLLAVPIWYLWNAFFPIVLGFKTITYTQAFILYLFVKVIRVDFDKFLKNEKDN